MVLCSKCGKLVDEKLHKHCPHCDNELFPISSEAKKENLVDEIIPIENPFINSTRRKEEELEELKEEAKEEVEEKLEEKVEQEVEIENIDIDEEIIPIEIKAKEIKEELKEKPKAKAKPKKKKVTYDKEVIKQVKSTIKDKPKKAKKATKATDYKITNEALEAFKLNPPIRRKLSRKERRSLYYSTIIVMILLLITLVYLAYYSMFGNFESPISDYYSALNIASEKQILNSYPPCIRKNEEFKALINQFIAPMKSYPEARFRYEIISKKRLNLRELDKQQTDYDLTCGKGKMKITEALTVRVQHIQKQNAKAEEIKEEIDIIIGKIDRKWYILE